MKNMIDCFIFQPLAVKIPEVSQSYLEFIVFKSHSIPFNLKLYLTGLGKKKKSLQNSMYDKMAIFKIAMNL